MRIRDGDTSRVIYFVAVDATDLKTRETSLSGTDVWYELDGGTVTQMTTPTITAVDATNAPGVFDLAIDESGMVTLSAGEDSVELMIHIEATEMAPVTRVIEIYRREVTTGNTLDVNANGEAGLDLDNTSGTLAAAQFATGFITAAKFAAGAIDAAAIATNAIDADALAADAVTKITDDIMAEVLTEPSQAIPPTTGVADVADALRYLYFALTNRVDVDDTAGAKEFYNRAESAVQWKKAISDSGTVYTEDTGAAGP